MLHKISFCTVAMNRLSHLKKTLPKNIKDNSNYKNLEFIVLDYNSKDGLYIWIRNNLYNYIENGTLKYFRTEQPIYFDRSHSRNVAFKLATGKVVCNVDADNFTGEGFAEYVNEAFCKEKGIVITGSEPSYTRTKSVVGRVCVYREHFDRIKGFDENMKNYGWEDVDFVNRLINLGLKPVYIQADKYLNAIEHDDFMRFKNESFSNNIQDIYICYLTPIFSKILVLLKQKKFILSNLDFSKDGAKLARSETKGTWKVVKQTLILYNENTTLFRLDIKDDKNLEFKQVLYHLITDLKFLTSLKLQLPIMWNKFISDRNSDITIANLKGYGEAVVYKNFSETGQHT